MDARTDAVDLPKLEAFDQEFGREPAAILRAHRRRSRLWFWLAFGLLVGAGAGAFALAWPEAVAGLRPDLPSFGPPTETASRATEQVDRLVREIEELRQEVQELTAAQRQAEETIAALRSGEHATTERVLSFWFSDTVALQHGLATEGEPNTIATTAPARGPMTARPRTGETRRGGPLSLDPQQ
jgi:hypothetical protein